MLPDFSSRFISHFTVSEGFPSGYSGFLLPGASVQTAVGSPGIIITQKIAVEESVIELSFFHFGEKIKIPFQSNSKMLNAPVALINNFLFQGRSLKKIFMKQGQYIFLSLAGKRYEAVFEKGKDYLLFNIGYTENKVREISTAFPESQPSFFARSEEGKAFAIVQPATLPREIKRLTQNILTTAWVGKPTAYILNKKADIFLCKLLIAEDQKLKNAFNRRSDEIEKINGLAELLTADIEERHPLPELARKTNMNENKLQRLFKNIFGKTIYHFQLTAKMEKAKRLILDDNIEHTIKYAAFSTGYKSMSSFEKAFKKYFGYTPSSLIKK